MLCPRRDDNPLSSHMFPNEDYWRQDETCSFCGGLSQDRLFRLIEAGASIDLSRRSYKYYLRYVPKEGPPEYLKFYTDHLDLEGHERLVDMIRRGRVRLN